MFRSRGSDEAACAFRLEARRSGDRDLLAVAGDVDIATCDALRSALDQLLEEPAGQLVIDLTDLSFLDSTGLGVLVRAHKQASAAGIDFAIVCPPGQVHDLFAITRLVGVLQVIDTLDEVPPTGGSANCSTA
jgi:anti-sigma B factor antagonist